MSSPDSAPSDPGADPGADGTLSTDVVIVGAGPVGLFAVFELGMLKMRAHLVDALDMAGGQCAALYPEKPIYDIPGFPRIEAQQLIENLQAQITPFAPQYHLGEQVTALEARPDGRRLVTTSAGTRIECAAVLIAAGAGAFGPNRPPLDGIEHYERSSVHYLVKRREDFRGKRIVIAGGGDSAVDWAVSLAEVAAQVMVVHRRPKFRAAPDMVARMQALADDGRVEMVVPYQLAGLDGDPATGRLSAVLVATLEGETRRLEADALLPFFGLAMNLGPIGDWGLDLDRNHLVVDPATCRTSADGVYAVGDIVTYPGKLKLILSGFSEAAMAAHDIYGRVYPDQALHFEYSTTKGLPGAG
ncbi:MAG: NAD(P)/FAD-dependent oxidoreductase [Alphaproteobacteria bacterium]